MLRDLPLDTIKIDRSFVAPISQSAQALDLIGRIIAIIKALSLRSLAEGVETERELSMLSAKGCDLVQGYVVAPALPVPGLIEFLQERSRPLRAEAEPAHSNPRSGEDARARL